MRIEYSKINSYNTKSEYQDFISCDIDYSTLYNTTFKKLVLSNCNPIKASELNNLECVNLTLYHTDIIGDEPIKNNFLTLKIRWFKGADIILKDCDITFLTCSYFHNDLTAFYKFIKNKNIEKINDLTKQDFISNMKDLIFTEKINKL